MISSDSSFSEISKDSSFSSVDSSDKSDESSESSEVAENQNGTVDSDFEENEGENDENIIKFDTKIYTDLQFRINSPKMKYILK